MHQFTVPLHSKPHRLRKVHNVFSFNLPPIIFRQNDRDLLHATRRWYIESTQKVGHGEEHSPAAAGTRTHDLSITSPAL